ncbi:MAG: multicopper oxidase domain-containing protein [Chloroflexi bacterium]|nr:multicopper oxidase domain-containing protein [Chloroflexota bacterium]
MVATDGWIALPGSLNPIPGVTTSYYPDPYAAANGNQQGQTTYIFGFRQVPTGTDPLSLKGQAQASAPLLYVNENTDVTIRLTNAGLQQRPDLVDSHTIHWHGFRNAIPLFDGVPEMSISVPIGQNFTYYYKPINPGTYMYHCHFEDVEHVHMGMTGVIFVRALQNTGMMRSNPADPINSTLVPAVDSTNTPIPLARLAGGPASSPLGYVYNDGLQPTDPNSSAYDREFTIFLSEVWAKAHYNDAHIQPTDWSEYAPDFWLMNGRCYPDTLAPSSNPLVAPSDPRLQFQPISSLVTANEGEKVLLRAVSLGYQQSSLNITGIDLRLVGKDAVFLRSNTDEALRTGIPRINPVNTEFSTNTIYIGPGESVDAIFIAPTFSGGTGTSGLGYDTYLFYNRNFANSTSGSSSSYGGQMTEIRIYPAGTLQSQTAPNY